MFTIPTHLISNNTLDGAPPQPPSRPRSRRKKRGLQINTLSSHPRKLCSSGDILEDIKRAASLHLPSIFFCKGSNNIAQCPSFLDVVSAACSMRETALGALTFLQQCNMARRKEEDGTRKEDKCATVVQFAKLCVGGGFSSPLPYKGIPPTERGGGGESFLRENRILYLFCRLFWKL